MESFGSDTSSTTASNPTATSAIRLFQEHCTRLWTTIWVTNNGPTRSLLPPDPVKTNSIMSGGLWKSEE
ncbi:hypothetical protein PGTUg99_006741 [Puccinia graminis f. sp. tritici]|uniref:Uncharacterized protein n=1 Tax=Puccinia graminis f. sp. tritici TaxID=56615 RepID=A0A5B0M9N4_PUCGR|nr:hypothetical protein PGTUg99_006741 [Puccinia graminis f. sp. tritici]